MLDEVRKRLNKELGVQEMSIFEGRRKECPHSEDNRDWMGSAESLPKSFKGTWDQSTPERNLFF